jgi:hypothetical protein
MLTISKQRTTKKQGTAAGIKIYIFIFNTSCGALENIIDSLHKISGNLTSLTLIKIIQYLKKKYSLFFSERGSSCSHQIGGSESYRKEKAQHNREYTMQENNIR